jgi:hypothetical protein
MLHTIHARPGRAKHREAPRCRLVLERLEDRLVPSIPNGTILVATAPSPYASTNQSSFPTGLLAVNPATGAETALSTGGLFSLPTYSTEAPNGQLYMSDLTAFGTGAIFQVEPDSGRQSLVAKGGFINGPNVLVFLNGFLYVADEGDASGSIHNLVKVDPSTGQQTLITTGSNGGFRVPTGIAPGPGDTVYVTDEPGNFAGTDAGKIWLVNLDTGQQTVFSSNNPSQGMLFNHPVDVALDANGNLIVVNTGSPANNGAGSVFRVNSQTGVQTLITAFGPYSGTDSVTVGEDGTIFVGAIASGSKPGAVLAVNPATGASTTLTSDDLLSLVEGIRTYQAVVEATATTTTLTSSLNPSVVGQALTFTATVTSNNGTPTGSVQFQVDGGSTVTIGLTGTGSASFTTSSLAIGQHIVTATYLPSGNFLSSSDSLTQVVNSPALTATTTTVSSSANPSLLGQSVTFTATVTPDSGTGTPTGTIQFQIDGVSVGAPVSLSRTDTATYSTAALAVGTHTITASYSGDNNFAPSGGSLPSGQAVTGAPASNDDLGLLLLDPAGSGSLMVTGNGSVAINGSGSVVVDSNATRAAVLTGHGMVTAADIDVTGGTQTTGQAGFSAPIDHEPAIGDPFALALPSPPSPTFAAVNDSGSTPLTLQPGTYIGGIKVSGQGSVKLAPGVYYLQGGGISVSGKGSITGSGVVIINAPGGSQDTISISGQGTVTLSAPTSGAFQGFAIFQDPSSSNPVSLSGQAALTLTGVLYVPGAPVSISGNASVTINPGPGTAGTSPVILGALIAYDLSIDGNGALTINPDDPPGGAAAFAKSSSLLPLRFQSSSAQPRAWTAPFRRSEPQILPGSTGMVLPWTEGGRSGDEPLLD